MSASGPKLLALLAFVALPLVIGLSPASAREQQRGTTANDASKAPGAAWRKVVSGRLKNGVRYAILPRHSAEPGVGLLVRSEGGFIAERRPGERGLAHLIEHVFFLDSTREHPNDARRLVRIGLPLTFPAANAGSTSWRESNFYLSTRTNSATDLGTLLTLFGGLSSDLSFRPEAVDAARAEVVREMADKRPGNEAYASYIAAVAPGSPGDVIDAQNSDDVPTASIATIRDLYRRLYQPDAMMVVVVGDVDATQTKALIEKSLGRRAPVKRATRPSPPVFDPARIDRVSVSTRPDGRRSALVTVVSPTPPVPATRRGQARATLMDMLATRVVSDRLIASQPGAAAGKVGMFIENSAEGHRQIMLWDNFPVGGWQPAVTALRRASCDLVSTGFSDTEWETAKRNVMAELQQRTIAMRDKPNVDLAKDLSHALADGRDLIAPDQLLRYAEIMLPQVSTREASGWWREQWGSGVEHLRVEAPELSNGVNPLQAVQELADSNMCRPDR